MEGLLTIDNVLCINEPKANDVAESEILQLKKAIEVGFRIPKTCVTSDKGIALRFIDRCRGRAVAKSLYSPLIEYPDKDFFIFTNAVTELDNIPELEIGIAPTIFQESLQEKTD